MEGLFLGIDPGLNKTGWGIVFKSQNKLYYKASGIISIQNKSTFEKLGNIFSQLNTILNLYKPNYCSIENTYVNINYSTSLKLAQARAAAIIACCNAGLTLSEYPARTIKKIITGCGKADKLQVAKMLSICLLEYNSLNAGDETDALAIAVCNALCNKRIDL